MTTPRIEEIVDELINQIYDYEDTRGNVQIKITEAIKQAHQAGIDEAVEVVNKKLIALSWSAENETSDAIRIIYEVRNTIKALQDNK